MFLLGLATPCSCFPTASRKPSTPPRRSSATRSSSKPWGRTGDACVAELVSTVFEAVDAFAGGEPQADDITCIAVRRRELKPAGSSLGETADAPCDVKPLAERHQFGPRRLASARPWPSLAFLSSLQGWNFSPFAGCRRARPTVPLELRLSWSMIPQPMRASCRPLEARPMRMRLCESRRGRSFTA